MDVSSTRGGTSIALPAESEARRERVWNEKTKNEESVQNPSRGGANGPPRINQTELRSDVAVRAASDRNWR